MTGIRWGMGSYFFSKAARFISGSVLFLVLGATVVCRASTATLNFSPAVTHIPVKQSTKVTDAFTITTGGSFKGNVTLAVSGLPGSIATSWSSNPVKIASGVGTSTLTVEPNATVSPNWYTFSVTATGDGLSVTWQYTVEVEPSAGVQVTLSGPAVSVPQQGTGTLNVTAETINGILPPAGGMGVSATVVSGLPSGVTASWSMPAVGYNTVGWTLTLTAGSGVVTGSYPIDLSVSVTDVNSGLVYSQNPTFGLDVALLAQVTIGTTNVASIQGNFLGFSHEWYDAQTNMGSAETGINTIYRQLLRNLSAYGSGPVNIRIGGNSTDTSVEPTPTTVTPFAELATAMGNQFELGVNMGADNVNLAVDQATNFVANMPAGSISAIEIGNEPDLYHQNGLRASTYDFADYLQDFGTWSSAVMPLLPAGVKLAGPDGDYYTQVGSNVTSYLSAYASNLSIFCEHFYAASPEDNPAPDFLLTSGAATAVVQQPNFAASVAAAHANGLLFREGEFGAISEQAVHGISDAFGAALWSVDTMFQMANAGVDGVNWEASDGNYNNPFPFLVTNSGTTNTYAISSINPMYYGLLMFQEAIGSGAQLLPVNVVTPANLTAWATLPTGGTPRLVVLNKDETQTGNVQVSMPGYGHATVLRLTAPSYTSLDGVTFAGQTFDGSTDGTIQGTQSTETITGKNGTFTLAMAVTSAALVIFSN
jgi:hypothetical protein